MWDLGSHNEPCEVRRSAGALRTRIVFKGENYFFLSFHLFFILCVHIHVYTCIFYSLCAYTCVHMYCVHLYTCACVHACVCVFMLAYVCVPRHLPFYCRMQNHYHHPSILLVILYNQQCVDYQMSFHVSSNSFK